LPAAAAAVTRGTEQVAVVVQVVTCQMSLPKIAAAVFPQPCHFLRLSEPITRLRWVLVVLKELESVQQRLTEVTAFSKT
jgi:hypothetical protein